MRKYRIFGEVGSWLSWESLGVQLVPGEVQEDAMPGDLVCKFESTGDVADYGDRALRDIAFPSLIDALLTGFTSNFALQEQVPGVGWMHVKTFQVDQEQICKELSPYASGRR